jgi:hypothetical protein
MSVNHQFLITLPDGWRDTTCHIFEGPHDSGVQHNLVMTIVEPVDPKANLAKFAKDQIRESALDLPGFEMISEKEGRLQSSLPVYEVVYRYAPSDQQTLFQKVYFVIAAGKAYIFTSTFSKKTLQTVANEVDKIVATLRTPAQNARQ